MNKKSLDEINGSVKVPTVYESAFWQKFLAYCGPGALVAVGYMDPGNWLTSLTGGAQYRYSLLSVLILSILIAMIMQSLSIKLGVVTRTDLAQAIAARVSKPVRIILWILNELAMMATDLTGVIGTSVALYLLFHLPLIVGVLLTVADVIVVLLFLQFGIRRIEFIVLATILIVAGIFTIEVVRAHPEWSPILNGCIPSANIINNHAQLLLSLGIIGATIMPHNIYLHSALAQSRRYDEHDPRQVHETLQFANWDSIIHLVAALLVNALLMIMGGTLFFHHGNLNSLADVFDGLNNSKIVGSLASPVMSGLFGFALLITGLISSITSTLAGQIVMEGYINLRLPLWKRRLLTRLVTLIPVIIIGCCIHFNEQEFEQLIIIAQIILSVALPFTLFPLIIITSNHQIMGQYANRHWQMISYLIIVLALTFLNFAALF
ncbi:manganese transport protein MntH [Limosilactobacillus coleohominis 101-4-CHN]|uniref:Manganese transport protein MntH n=1 Tax=Limosilactobacillus coleohominis 101-4-CHN TaxID=575594 RepID=C7XWD2_9LACO|nr:Nramp family divalent metal transporter [Limosilactobacillus coleohominis]EEU30192.1 manganese transport protein MntH [Limosilactobacillus coleohominis 101-4-CHN]